MYSVFIDGLKLPIAPDKLSMKIKGNNKVISLINEGEMNVLKKAGLTDVTFTALIPAFQYDFADRLQKPDVFLAKFEDLKVNDKRFQFIITRTKPNREGMFSTNLKMALEDYEIIEDQKDGFDIVVKVNLRQAPDYGTKTLNLPSPSSPQQVATVEQTRPAETAPNTQPDYQNYTVASGDSLYAIARKMLGDGSRWGEIYELNRSIISNPNLIYSGQVLRLP